MAAQTEQSVPNEAPTSPEPQSSVPQIQNEKDPKAELLAALSPPILGLNIAGIDPKKLQMAKDFGIPIGEILDWVQANQAWQQNISQVLVNVAESSGKSIQFFDKLEKAQLEQEKILRERKEAEQRLLETHPELKQAAPQGGNMLGGLMQLLPELLKGISSAPAAPTGINYAEIGQQFVQAKLKEALDPTPSPLEEVGALLLKEAASKLAGKALT